jgi:calcium/calmodulin-dependent protein kinase I
LASTSLPGYKEAKACFDFTALQVRKGVVRCEFVEFPEGCKGSAFREVYQLNARVRVSILHGFACCLQTSLTLNSNTLFILSLSLISQLKSGSFATVCRGTHRASGKKVAIKCVLRKDLPPTDDAAIYDEVAILASLSHPHIVPLIDFFEEKDCYFLVMELMSGGDLFDRIGKKKAYSEGDARDLVVKMLKAMSYCHSHKIAHCDMKPKNLLLMSEDNDSYIKLADFGFAARCHEPKTLNKQCGTPFFVSPEILMRQAYDQMSDMWSVGCIVFLLLSGNLPFMGRSQKELFRKIVSGKYEFDDDDWCEISDDAKDLVNKLLVLDPDNRLSASEALRHKWLKMSNDRLSRIKLQGASQRLKTFNARMKLRSAMIAVDWVGSLKKTSWLSNRKLDSNGEKVKTRSSTGSMDSMQEE